MKQLLLAGSIVFACFACNQTSSGSADGSATNAKPAASSKEEMNRQIAMNGVKAFESGTVDEMLNGADANCVDYGDGSTPPIKGLDSVKSMVRKLIKDWRATFPDTKVSGISATSHGDTVMVWAEYKGTWKDDFMGQKATGKSFDIYQVDYFLFNADGKMTEHRATPITNEIAKQVGMKF